VPAYQDDDDPPDGRTRLELHLRLSAHGDWRVDHAVTRTRASGHNLRLALTCLAERAGRPAPIALTDPDLLLNFEIPSARFQTIVNDLWARSCACDDLVGAVTIIREDRLQLCTEDVAALLRVTKTEVRDAFTATEQIRD